MRTRRRWTGILAMSLVAGVFIAGVIATLAGASSRDADLPAGIELRGDDSYRPRIDPAEFQAAVDNPYYPLVPGTVMAYVESLGRATAQREVTVMRGTRMVMGVPCVVVHDKVQEDGALKEDTYDWLAQDKNGTVWYFGEDTKRISAGGLVSTRGSWEAGVDGAQPGIVMQAHPALGEPYRQGYGRGVAEDMGQIVEVGQLVKVPAGTFADCVKTKEWSLLASRVENKWYCRGVGMVKRSSTAGETATLVSITRE